MDDLVIIECVPPRILHDAQARVLVFLKATNSGKYEEYCSVPLSETSEFVNGSFAILDENTFLCSVAGFGTIYEVRVAKEPVSTDSSGGQVKASIINEHKISRNIKKICIIKSPTSEEKLIAAALFGGSIRVYRCTESGLKELCVLHHSHDESRPTDLLQIPDSPYILGACSSKLHNTSSTFVSNVIIFSLEKRNSTLTKILSLPDSNLLVSWTFIEEKNHKRLITFDMNSRSLIEFSLN